MISLSWLMRCFMCLVFLSTSFSYQVADTNKTLPNSKLRTIPCNNSCMFYQGGKIINLARLQRLNGPRFTEPGSRNYSFSYNPCRSFSLPQTFSPDKSDCYADVAICMFAENGARYQNIGKQSTVSCGLGENNLPWLEFTNVKNPLQWKAKVHLKCDKEKIKAKDAEFKVTGYYNNVWHFRLSHNCACPDGCPPLDDEPPDGEAPSCHSPWVHDLEYGLIGAFSFLGIVVPLFIWRCVRRQNNGNDENRPLLDEENDRAVDYAANHFNDLDGAASNKDINIRGNR